MLESSSLNPASTDEEQADRATAAKDKIN